MKRVVQDVLDRSPRLQALTPPKTREVVQWCRQRGYTPPDPEPPQPKNDDESIEDILTQIDNEPGEFVPVWTWSTSSTGRLFHSVLLKLQADQYFRLSVACVGVLFLHLPVDPVMRLQTSCVRGRPVFSLSAFVQLHCLICWELLLIPSFCL